MTKQPDTNALIDMRLNATIPGETPTRQFEALFVAPVVPEHLARLKQLLEVIAAQTTAHMNGGSVSDAKLPFHSHDHLHYARLVLIEDAGKPTLLAFATDYDDEKERLDCSEQQAFEAYLESLVDPNNALRVGLEEVFGHCEGRNEAGDLTTYLRRRRVQSRTFYVGAPGRSVRQIRWEALLRSKVEMVLGELSPASMPPETLRKHVLDKICATGVKLPKFPAQPDLTSRLWWSLGLPAAAVLGSPVVAALLLQHFLSVPFLVTIGMVVACTGLLYARFRHLERTDLQFQPSLDRATHARFAHASATENAFLQNQLSHLVEVKPGPLRWVLLRIVLYVIQQRATYQYNKGKLGDIPSIHFARWALIPGRGVLFLSNFDNSWQSYLGDFIDKASSGLTAVWSNTKEYPRTERLVRAGSRDAGRFLAWTRSNQHATNVWYCAYPGLSIQNVNDNTFIRRGLSTPDEVDPATWLFRLRAVDREAADTLYSEEKAREPALPLERIQGIILRGYGQMPEARYILFRVKEQRAASIRGWIRTLRLTNACVRRGDADTAEPFINIAFSFRGLQRLGVDEALCQSFSTAFVQGASHEYRVRVNGDIGPNHPDEWLWGNASEPVDIVLLVFDKTPHDANAKVNELVAQAETAGLRQIRTLEGRTLPGRKEHFGFRDGIGQPEVQGCEGTELTDNAIAAGEILLGHRDGYGNLAAAPQSTSGFSFGQDGSYLVLRQLEQNVAAFWKHCVAQDATAPVRVAAKMVGRWPSGASLVRHPERDPQDARFEDEDDFSYLENDDDNDRYGGRCPFGAHIRRANPRDWNLGATRKESKRLSSLHRIIRRGRPYGAPFEKSMRAEALIEAAKAEPAPTGRQRDVRGLNFLCFNSNIERQFEFIQQHWCNNPHFAGLDNGPDPLLGFQPPVDTAGTSRPSFAIQADVRSNVSTTGPALANFVETVGSGYFFMPSIPAVRLLGEGRFDAQNQGAAAASSLEKVPPDEQLHIDELILKLRDEMKSDYKHERTLRDAHPKMHGCVRAKFQVEPDLPAPYAAGLFSRTGSYEAWVRFSNASSRVGPDASADIRGIGIKLMNVDRIQLLDGEEGCQTHDFLLISHNTFFAKDVEDFKRAADAIVRLKAIRRFPPSLNAVPGFPYSAFWKLVRYRRKAFAQHSSVLHIPYFSVVPYLLGSKAVKYALKPSSPSPNGGRAKVSKNAPANYLRTDLVTRLQTGPVQLDFLVQLQTDAGSMPVEDPRVAWDESKSPFKKVATLVLERLPEDFDMKSRDDFGDNLSFNPWRCSPEHRPLGGLNRARREVYRALTHFRHDRNAAPMNEP